MCNNTLKYYRRFYIAMKNDFTFPSRDGINNCHACSWVPDDGNIRGVVQIVHGMQEYIERYEDFAEFLVSRGFVVTGEDHLGHGKTAASESDLGFFTDEHPENVLIKDVHSLKKITQKKYPGVPYFIIGHSMGSFIMRKYLAVYGGGTDGAVIIGTGAMPIIATDFAILATNIEKLFWGGRHVSPLIEKLAFGCYNKRIKNSKSPSDWICSDADVVNKYVNDPLCSFKFTLNGYRTLFKIFNFVSRTGNLKKIPKDLPILIASGSEDPVGNYGKGPLKVYEQYEKLGLKDVSVKIYPEMRHEILNEKNKSDVYSDIFKWLDRHISDKK